MRVITSNKEMRVVVDRWRRNNKSIGLVPTMGALHEGHVALIRAARAACDRVVVSIYVNPLQFGAEEDLASYPRDLKRDSRVAAAEKVDVVFAPETTEMYPTGFNTRVEVGESLTKPLCGASRPGHFTGVATVVTKLLNLTRPQRAYFGQKDYQQTLVVKRLAEDLNCGCEMVVLPTVRDTDGLAKSSRNQYLSEAERRAAPVVYQAVKLAEGMLQVGERNPKDLMEAVRKRLTAEPLVTVDYIAAKDAATLEDLSILTGRVLFAVAVRIGRTRLIDNVVVDVPSGS